MNPNEKPCRTCMDFKSWAKIQKKAYDTEQVIIYIIFFISNKKITIKIYLIIIIII